MWNALNRSHRIIYELGQMWLRVLHLWVGLATLTSVARQLFRDGVVERTRRHFGVRDFRKHS